jgi:hypothetical protein
MSNSENVLEMNHSENVKGHAMAHGPWTPKAQ